MIHSRLRKVPKLLEWSLSRIDGRWKGGGGDSESAESAKAEFLDVIGKNVLRCKSFPPCYSQSPLY
jgi:hypothetical protein